MHLMWFIVTMRSYILVSPERLKKITIRLCNDRRDCVFPGQGAQQVGMLSDISEQYSEISETFTEASDALGIDLWKMVTDGPDFTE